MSNIEEDPADALPEDQSAFLIPVIGDKIHLIKRATKLYRSHWSAVGGKGESRSTSPLNHMSVPYLIEKPWGTTLSIHDQVQEKMNCEYGLETAMRETCEELFPHCRYPEDFTPDDFQDIVRIGTVDDEYETSNGQKRRAHLHFFLARLRRTDIKPNPREVSEFKPLDEIPIGDPIVPITKEALFELRFYAEEGMPLIRGDYMNTFRQQLSRPDIMVTQEEELIRAQRGGSMFPASFVYRSWKARGYLDW